MMDAIILFINPINDLIIYPLQLKFITFECKFTDHSIKLKHYLLSTSTWKISIFCYIMLDNIKFHVHKLYVLIFYNYFSTQLRYS